MHAAAHLDASRERLKKQTGEGAAAACPPPAAVAKLSAGACHFIAAVSQETKTLTLGSTQGIKTRQVQFKMIEK